MPQAANDQKAEVKKLIESAREHQKIGELAAVAGMGVLALLVLYGAFDVYRRGLKISKEKTLTGGAANLVAGILVLVGLGTIICALFVWPGLLR